jgi:hypothetical protein
MGMYLEFGNPVMHDGTNLTVRRGIKWAVAAKKDDIVDIPGGRIARISDIYLKKFSDINDVELEYEHDPSCHTLNGLLRAMMDVYGSGFDPDEIVTLVFFEVM